MPLAKGCQGCVPYYRGWPRAAALIGQITDPNEGTCQELGKEAFPVKPRVGSGLKFLANQGSHCSWSQVTEWVKTGQGDVK